MKVRLLYFGGLRAQKDLDSEWVELPAGSLAGDAAGAACAGLGPEWLACLRVAVNEEFAPREAPLREGDQVALLPPVSGGKG